MELTLVQRIVAGVLVACLIIGSGVLGWLRADALRRVREVDRPAVGGVLVDEAMVPEASEWSPLAAGVRTAATDAPPSRSGGRTYLLHQVRDGETLFRIAQRYGLSVAEIQRVNRLDSDLIRSGQLLELPSDQGSESLGGSYIWPVSAPVSSPFGKRWGRQHNGIDLAANHGDQIRASRDGEVWLAGNIPGYGETVILVHGDGSRTLYAHSSRILVKPGQQVKQGQVIALVGSTGNSTGPHLHFEIIVNDQPIDPIPHLRKR